MKRYSNLEPRGANRLRQAAIHSPKPENRPRTRRGTADFRSGISKFGLLAPVALAVWLSSLGVQLRAAPMGTAFTYQGCLSQNGSLATGRFDMTFTLYAGSQARTPVGATLTNEAVSVANGLFSTTLDFGPGIFTGEGRWLEIGVRPSGARGAQTAYNVLTPRQCLMPVP